jgi:outer membrane protein assembly factor BamE (lipoprotein component of BamABCDE complex)
MALRDLRLLFCAIACLALLGGCQPGKNLRKANVDQVTPGMAKKQVESILGLPTNVDTKQFDLTTKTTYVYTQGSDSVTIIFWDDKVESKETTLKD